MVYKKLDAIEVLKVALMTLSVLALPYSSGHLTLDTDACNVQVGCVLQQKRLDDTTKRFCYCSLSLTGSEQWCDSKQRKCLAMVWSELVLRS